MGRLIGIFLICLAVVTLLAVPANSFVTHSIEDVADSGKVIVLDDDSVWGIESVDSVDSSIWLSGDDVQVVKNDENSSYPYLLINKDEKEMVHAKYMGKP